MELADEKEEERDRKGRGSRQMGLEDAEVEGHQKRESEPGWQPIEQDARLGADRGREATHGWKGCGGCDRMRAFQSR